MTGDVSSLDDVSVLIDSFPVNSVFQELNTNGVVLSGLREYVKGIYH